MKTYRQVIASLLLLTCSLIMSVPSAYALSYNGLAFADLNSLTFSGITFSESNFSQHIRVAVQDTALAIGDQFSRSWTATDMGAGLPLIGSAEARANDFNLSASTSILAPGFTAARIERGVDLFATQTGLLTLSMNYRIEEVGQIVGPGATPFFGEQQVALALNGGLSQALNRTSVAANETLDIARTQTGTLTTSLFLNQGDVARLSIQTNSTAIASIPLPDTFFAFALGLAILIILNEKLSLVRLNQPSHTL